MSIQQYPEDAGWEKSTEEFLRKLRVDELLPKLRVPSQQSATAASSLYSPEVAIELRSGSIADYVDDDIIGDNNECITSPQRTACRDTVDRWMDTVAELDNKIEYRKDDIRHGAQNISKDGITIEVSKLQTSMDHPASDVNTARKVKVC